MKHGIQQSWRLSKQCYRYLRQHPALLWLPIIHKVLHLFLITWIALPLIHAFALHEHNHYFKFAAHYHIQLTQPEFYIIFFILLYITNVVGTFIYSTIHMAVLHDLEGTETS